MSTITTSMDTINFLETLSEKNTSIHRIHPLVKLIMTLVMIVVVVSYPPFAITGLISFSIYPAIMMTLGEIPFRPLLKRLLIALPFSFFAGVSNIIFNQTPAFVLGGFTVTLGWISFFSIMVKTMLTVMSVLILIATTPLPQIAYTLLKLKIPKIFVIQLMLTYRYISVLLEQVSNMTIAYRLRAPSQKAIKMQDMGIFVGQLLLKSFIRADNIYEAMKCRGFDGGYHFVKVKKLRFSESALLVACCTGMIGLRLFDFSSYIGGLF
ncbi:MAG: cobalt ECF transporter T component CbiQ [Eubacteriaceae bacterium]